MRAVGLAVLLFAGAAVFAQDAVSSAPKPDYSRDSLLRLLADHPRPEREPGVRFRVGAVEFRALGTQWRFVYLPIMMPFSGSQFGVTNQLPDPFLLTGTAIATPPRVWRDRRAMEKELKRIGKSSVKVKIDAD